MEVTITGQDSKAALQRSCDSTRLAGRHPARHRFMTCCGGTAMLLDGQAEPRVSTGLDALDEVLGGLYWGDNVVWRLDRAPLEPFYRAIASTSGIFETRTAVSVGNAVNTYGVTGLAIMEAGHGANRARPADLLREIRRMCRARGRRLFLFESLDSMVRSWGAADTREFFTRCCPLLL